MTNLDSIIDAIKSLIEAENSVHRMYPNTATCRSGPGVVSGQGFTRHCAASCSNPVHQKDAALFSEAMYRLYCIVKEYENDQEDRSDI